MPHRCFAILLALLALIPCARAQCHLEWRSAGGHAGPDNYVFASTSWDPDGPGPLPAALVVSGDFTAVGTVPANHIARWDGSAWHEMGEGLSNSVRAFLVHDETLYAAGYFRVGGGSPQIRVMTWTGQSWQPFGLGLPGLDNHLALCVYQDRIIIGGPFPQGIQEWTGSVWRTIGNGVNGPVTALLPVDGALYVGGNFQIAGNIGANGVALWNGTTWSQPAAGMLHATRELLIFDGSVIAAGGAGVSRLGSAFWQPIGTLNLADVADVAVYNGTLYAAGWLRDANTATNTVSRWTGSAWQPLAHSAPIPNQVPVCFDLTVHNGELIASGNFFSIGNSAADYLARFDGSTWRPVSREPGFGSVSPWVGALTTFRGELIAGGSFTSAGSTPINRIARWDGAAWQPLGAGISGSVNALTMFNSDLIAAGAFTQAGGIPAASIARWDGAQWHAMGKGFPGQVGALSVLDGQLIAAGSITSAPYDPVRRWNGSSWVPLPGLTYPDPYPHAVLVSALAIHEGNLYAGGTFAIDRASQTVNIARWDGTAWRTLGSGLPSVTTGVCALASYRGDLIAAGGFDIPGCHGVARWDGAAWHPMREGIYAGWTISLAVFHDLLVLGGASGASGILATWDGDRWSSTAGFASSSGISGASVAALHIFNDEVIAAGAFTRAGDIPAGSWARLGCAPCYPNCDGSAAPLSANDFLCFINRFAQGHQYANCDGSLFANPSFAPTFNANDFTCFLNAYAAGCP